MKPWIGAWLIAVAALHTVFALVVFGDPLRGLLARGLFDAIGGDLRSAVAAWFLLFGLLLFVFGLAVAALERAGGPLPASLGWSLLGLALLGVVLMPASGFWLAFPPAIAILLRTARVGRRPV
jgi:hypothetical protein